MIAILPNQTKLTKACKIVINIQFTENIKRVFFSRHMLWQYSQITRPNALILYFTACIIYYLYNSKTSYDRQKHIAYLKSA